MTELAELPLEELVALFGNGNMMRFDVDLVAALPVPPSARTVLTDIGLPRETEFFFGADPPQLRPDGLCLIGRDYGADICVDRSGRVVSMGEEDGDAERFVNSDLGAFLRFLALVGAARETFTDLPEEDIEDRAEELADTLAGIDREAFADPDAWWALVFEQMGEGLL